MRARNLGIFHLSLPRPCLHTRDTRPNGTKSLKMPVTFGNYPKSEAAFYLLLLNLCQVVALIWLIVCIRHKELRWAFMPARFIYMHAALFLRATGRKRQEEKEEKEREVEACLQTRGQLYHRVRLAAKCTHSVDVKVLNSKLDFWQMNVHVSTAPSIRSQELRKYTLYITSCFLIRSTCRRSQH